MKAFLIYLLAAVSVVLAPPVDARNVYVANYCPFDVVFDLWQHNWALTYTFARRQDGWSDRKGGYDRARRENCVVRREPRPTHGQRSSALDWMLRQGPQVAYGPSTCHHACRDMWADIGLSLCHELGAFPYFVSISSGGDAIFSAGCNDDW